jgi:hypothetical protein
MEWLALLFFVAFVYGLVIWPLWQGRRFFTPDAAARARDVANQVYAAQPDGLAGPPFDPVPRGPLVAELPADSPVKKDEA